MSKTAELRAQLAKAEEEEAASNLQARYDELVENYQGRAFASVAADVTKNKCVYLHLYKKFQIDPHFGGYIKMREHTITTIVNADSQGVHQVSCTKGYDENAGPGRIMPTIEIPVKVFKDMWSTAKLMAHCGYTTIMDVIHQDIRLEQLIAERMPAPTPVDFPFVQLEPGDTTFFSKSPFVMPADRYLITPASLEDARRRLNEAEDELARGSMYYQECDMKYVNGRTERIAKMRAKLDEAQ